MLGPGGRRCYYFGRGVRLGSYFRSKYVIFYLHIFRPFVHNVPKNEFTLLILKVILLILINGFHKYSKTYRGFQETGPWRPEGKAIICFRKNTTTQQQQYIAKFNVY